MRKIIFTGLLISVVFFSIAVAQYEQPQWEYLVVQENGNVNLNELGRKSWELVGITFNEGNPVRFFFKRAYISERTRLEAEQAKNAEPAKVNFIELDQAEFYAKQGEIRDGIKNKFEQSLKSADLKLEIPRFDYDSQRKQIYADIVVDGSSVLLKDGNKYRLSEAKKYIQQIAGEIFNKIGLTATTPSANFYSEYGNFDQRGNVNLRLYVSVRNGEAKRNVVQGNITGNWNVP